LLLLEDVSNPIGTITLWSGGLGEIPENWLLCDGDNGTPDLTDRFVIGAGGSHAVDAVGGEDNHDHAITDPAHMHSSQGQVNVATAVGTSVWSAEEDNSDTSDETTGITVDSKATLPPYYALAYIMRIA
jgi:microcystin-dependent protein